MNDILNNYRLMKIDKSVLEQILGKDLHNAEVDSPLCIRSIDVDNAIGLVLSGRKQRADLVEWVNVVWFTDLFYFLDEETDSIISVLEILETMDEDGVCISDTEMRSMQFALSKNKEYIWKQKD